MKKDRLRHLFVNRWMAFVHDLVWVAAAIVVSYWFRYNLESIPQFYYSSLRSFLVIAVPVHGLVFFVLHLYRGFWRFISVPDILRIIKSVLVGTLLVTTLCTLLNRFQGVPRSVIFLYPVILTAGMCFSRMMYRWFTAKKLRVSKKTGKRTLIAGAGMAGEMLVRDLLGRPEYQAVAFIDDDPLKRNRDIHGVRVMGASVDLVGLVDSLSIELVLLAIPSADKNTIRELAEKCAEAEVEYRTLPSILEISECRVDVNSLREVTVLDLLGREQVALDLPAITDSLSEKVVLVTGGGGSIGSELCRQIGGRTPALLIIFDNCELNLYHIDHELRECYPTMRIETILGDVKDHNRVDWVFKSFRPAVVFHAAAYKHVPMVEANPAEGVNNNVFGTRTVADAAHRYGTERLVMISTDKAVNPANIMGASKRVAEMYCQRLDSESETRFITTRFGNVLGSSGSVVPLFKKQIESGGPVTVTHQDVTRYFMTTQEAVSLILQAASMGKGGEIFVLDMGEPVLIRELAEQMIRLSGKHLEKTIAIEYIGLRPGEKLYEELLDEREKLQVTSHEKLLLASCREDEWDMFEKDIEELYRLTVDRNVDGLYDCLSRIVPEFRQGERIVES